MKKNRLPEAKVLRQKAEKQLITQQLEVSSLPSENDLHKLSNEHQVHRGKERKHLINRTRGELIGKDDGIGISKEKLNHINLWEYWECQKE